MLCEGGTDAELLGPPVIEPEVVSEGTGTLSVTLGVTEGSPEGGCEDGPSGVVDDSGGGIGVVDDSGGMGVVLDEGPASVVVSEVVIDPGSVGVGVGVGVDSGILVLVSEVAGRSVAADDMEARGRLSSRLAGECFILLR